MSFDFDRVMSRVEGSRQSVDAPTLEPSTPEQAVPSTGAGFDLDRVLQRNKERDELAVNTMAAGDAQRSVEVGMMAKFFNESPDVVALNFDEKKKIYDANQVAKVMEPAENLTDWTANNADVAPVVKEVLGPLAEFDTKLAKLNETLRQQRIAANAEFSFSDEPHGWTPDQEEPKDGFYRKMREIGEAGIASGAAMSQQGYAWYQAMKGQRDRHDKEFLKWSKDIDEKQQAFEDRYGQWRKGIFNFGLFNATQQLGQMADATQSYFGEMAEWAGYGAGAGLVGGFALGAGSVAAPAVALASAGAVFAQVKAMEGGLSYKEQLELGVSDPVAKRTAAAVGYANGILETAGTLLGGKLALSAIGPLKQMVAKKVAGALTAPTTSSALKHVALRYLGANLSEVGTEVGQEVFAIAGEEAGRILSNVGQVNVFAQDFTGKYNTQLTEQEEAEFQAWALKHGKIRDLYDYDLRGWWKEQKESGASLDLKEGMHLTDKYKKPNHPTFSSESQYAGADGIEAGEWIREGDKDVFIVKRAVNDQEQAQLEEYFKKVEPNAELRFAIDNRRAIEGITLEEAADRIAEIAIKTTAGSAFFTTIGAGPVLTHQIRRVRAAQSRQEAFQALATTMKEAEVVKTNPDIIGDAVQHMADKSEASNVYIDGQAFAQTMAENKITIDDVRQVAPEVADQIETAMRTGGDIVIPTGEYAVKIAPTDMGESLSMHVRTAEDQLSAAEAVQVDRVVKEQLRTAINDPEALEQQANEQLDGEYKEEAKKLEEHYKAELEKHPRFKGTKARTQARYAATVATQMAKRAGIAPSELMNFAPTLVFTDADQAQQTAQNGQGIREHSAYEQEQTGTAEAQAKLNAEIKEWERKIDRMVFLVRKPKQIELMLTQTPLVMKLVGAKFRKLYIASHAVDGMFPKHMMPKNSKKNWHPEMTAEVMKQIPGALADPVAVLRSRNNSYVFVLDVKAGGKTVIVPVMFEAEGFNGRINKLTTNFGKDGFDKYIKDQVNHGNLVYINKRKADDQRPSAGSNSLCDAYNHLPNKDSVLTEADLVNLQKEYPGYYQTFATPTDPLVTIHNIRETGLLNVDKLGALPVPSLAVTKAGNEYNQYGEISLIGTKGMVDPSQTPVFSADAYTARFPKLNWTNSVDRPKAEALAKEVKEAQMRVGDSGTGATYYLINSPDRDRAADALANDVAGMAMFLNSKGIKFRLMRTKPELSVDATPEIQQFVESENLTSENLEEGSAAHKRISDLAIDRIRKAIGPDDVPAKGAVAFKRRIHKVAVETYEATGFIPLKQAKSIVGDVNQYKKEMEVYKKGKAPIDNWATKKALQKKIEPMQAEYQKFIADKVGAVFKAPRIQHGERTLPFNLANIVKVMTSRKSIRGAEEGALGGYGYGAIRASASKQYGSIEEMQADRDRVVDRDTSHASEQEVDAKLKAFMEAAGEYFRWGAGPGSYEAFEAAAEVLYKAAEKGGAAAAIRAAARTDFKALPPELVKQGVEALDAAKNVLTDYMEAKPQRAVQLSEFAGAVVPETIGAEARAVLENAGLKIQTYDPKQKGSRLQATEELTQSLQAERGDVLFQLMGEKGAGRLSPAESQARLDALKVAKQMRLAGKDPKEIRLATGWERGTDGLWRFEFPDAQWKDGFFEDRYPDETTYMLSDLVDSPELFEAYPELRTYRISFSVKESDTLGSHNSGDKRIWVNTIQFSGDPKADADVIRSTLLHEIQHAIQKQEGFVGGGNPFDSMMAYQKLLKEEVKPLYEMMRSPEWILYQNLLRTGTIDEIAAAEKDPVVQNVFALQQKIRKKYSIDKNDKVIESVIDKPHSDNSVVWNWDEKRYGYKIYERLGGEVESRNVEARMNMTDEQRRQTLLEETADVAPEDQIILGSPFLRPNTTRGTYAPGSNTISITLNGDLSTFAHEMGHWYLEQILKYSKRPDVDPTIVEDAETIKKELGIPDDWDSLTFDTKRKYHEKFAYLTEIYLATGKAPTKSTESFFARMGAWIADVYRQFVGGIKQQRSEQYAREFGEQLPDISPELQRVFDRMVASQDMLKQAEAAESLRPLFETKPEDMDEATWVEMQSQRMIAEAEGAAKINEIHAKDEKWYTGARSKLLRKLQREAKEIRDKIRERIETQLRNQDVYIAIEIFKTGGKALGLDNLKMDPDALKDAGYTVTEIAKLRNLGCVRKGGLTPTQARELLRPFARFKTDKRMIRALINAKPINEAIEEATTEECLRRHSEMFDPVKLDAAVTAALHTEARERMIANELKYLAGTKGMNSRVLNEAARRAAEALVAGTKVGQATVKKYMALESKASRKAYEALAKGDRKAAAVAKHQQLLYSKCVREAMELEKDVAKLKRLKAKIFQSDKKIAKTRDTGILGVARYILTNHGLGKIRAADMDPATAMRYVEKLQKYDYEKFVAFKGLMERHGYKPNDPGLNALTVQELRALIGDVEFCWKASRDAKVIRLGDAAKTRDEVVTELLQQGQSLGLKEYAPGRGEKVTASERASHGLLSIAAQLRRVESWCNSMDAGNPDHPFRRYIYDPVAQACAKYRVANAAIQEKLANLVAARRKDWDKMTDIEAPEIGYVFRTKSELIGAILHTGNQSNKQKLLLGGRGDDKPWTRLIEGPEGEVHVDTSAWDAFVQRCYTEGIITKEDMDFVQAVWDLMESEKPLIQKAFHQIYGFYFDEIPATEVQTPWGNYRGGYVPAMTDRYIVAEKGVQEEIERITENEYLSMMPVSRPGFAISRVAGYNKPLSLDIGQLCGHVEKTMRFAHIAPVVQEVAKIINDRDFTDFVNKINPHLISDLLAPWLKRAYNQRIDDGKTGFTSNLCSKYRSLAAMGIMMGNVVNAIQQTTGLSIAMSKVGAAKLVVANKKLLLERGALVEKVETLSPFMKARLKDRSFEYESRVKRVASANGRIFSQRGLMNKAYALDSKAEPVRNWISSHAYLLQTAMQIPIDITVWVAAFDEAVAKGMSDQEAALEADSVVRTTQSSFAAEDVAKVETGGAFKRMFLVFYNYFGMQYNLLLERKAEANLKPWYKKYGTMAADFMLIVWIPAVLSKVFELALKGELGGDDEDEWEAIDWIQLIIGEPIKNVIAFAPIVGGMINSAGGALAKKGSVLAQAIFGKDPYVGKPMSAPAVDLFESVLMKGLPDLYKIAEGEEVSRRRIIRELLDLFSILTRTPAGALKKPLGYIGNVMDGEESTDNPIYGVLRGK